MNNWGARVERNIAWANEKLKEQEAREVERRNADDRDACTP